VLSHVVGWTVIVVLAGVLAVAVVVPRLGGATPYTVLTGSMRPDRPPGTLVVVRPVDVDAIAVGDIVTYQLRSGEPEVVTHRVVSVGSTLGGERVLRTQGDANSVMDALPVRETQIKGRLWYSVPYLGRVNTLVSGQQRTTVMAVVVSGLSLYAGAMFIGAFRDRRQTRRTEEVSSS